MLFSNPKLKLSDEEFKSIAQAINSLSIKHDDEIMKGIP